MQSINKLRLKRKQDAKLRMKKMLKEGKPSHCIRMDELRKKPNVIKIPKIFWTKEEDVLVLDYSKTSEELAKVMPHTTMAIQSRRGRLKKVLGLPRTFKGKQAKCKN